MFSSGIPKFQLRHTLHQFLAIYRYFKLHSDSMLLDPRGPLSKERPSCFGSLWQDSCSSKVASQRSSYMWYPCTHHCLNAEGLSLHLSCGMVRALFRTRAHADLGVWLTTHRRILHQRNLFPRNVWDCQSAKPLCLENLALYSMHRLNNDSLTFQQPIFLCLPRCSSSKKVAICHFVGCMSRLHSSTCEMVESSKAQLRDTSIFLKACIFVAGNSGTA